MDCTIRKIVEIPLAIVSRILAQSCVTPLPELCREGLHMILLVSLIVLLGDFLVSTFFRMVHPIPTSSFIQLNDFYTHLFKNAAMRMRTCVG